MEASKAIKGLIAALVLYSSLSLPALAKAADVEYEVKAALVYKTIKFVSWPNSAFSYPDASIDVCILGEDPFGHAADPIASQSVNGRPVQIKRFPVLEHEVTGCHVLFISRSETDRLATIFAAIGDNPVLTIAEIDDFAASGGVINFSTRYNRIRFEVNADRVRRAGLEMNAQFLRMVTIVKSPDRSDP